MNTSISKTEIKQARLYQMVTRVDAIVDDRFEERERDGRSPSYAPVYPRVSGRISIHKDLAQKVADAIANARDGEDDFVDVGFHGVLGTNVTVWANLNWQNRTDSGIEEARVRASSMISQAVSMGDISPRLYFTNSAKDVDIFADRDDDEIYLPVGAPAHFYKSA